MLRMIENSRTSSTNYLELDAKFSDRSLILLKRNNGLSIKP